MCKSAALFSFICIILNRSLGFSTFVLFAFEKISYMFGRISPGCMAEEYKKQTKKNRQTS